MKTIDCTRCGGSGTTEHTHIIEGICFLCRGKGYITQATLELSEKRKAAKEEKRMKLIQQQKETQEKMWEDLHLLAKQNFDKKVDENNFDLSKLNNFNVCVKIFQLKKQAFTKELFEDILNNFGGKFFITEEYRLALCKYFRLNGVHNSNFEYKNDEYDYKDYVN